MICRANQVTGFYMMGTLVIKRSMDMYNLENYCKDLSLLAVFVSV